MEITGRLTANAIVMPVKGSDKKVTNFTVALNRKFISKGELIEQVTYVDCDYWFGENLAPYLIKGMVVRVYGYPEITAYISKKTGLAVGVFRLHAQDVEPLTSSKKAVNTEGELVDEPEVIDAPEAHGEAIVPAGEGETEGLPF